MGEMPFFRWGMYRLASEKGGDRTSITAFVLILALAVSLYAAYVGVYMDDVLIYLRVSRNIVEGQGPVFNPGDRHFSVTSPLWVFLLALFQKLMPAPGLMTWSKILYIAFLAGASFFFFLLLKNRLGIWAALAPFPLFFNPVTLTCSGGEIALLYFTLLGMIYSATLRKNFWLVGLFAALAYLARSEAALMLIPICCWRLWSLIRKEILWKRFAIELLQTAAIFLAVAMIWHVYYWISFHEIFPGTLQTKIIQGRSGKWAMYNQNMRPHILQFFHGRWYLLPLFLAGLAGLGAWPVMFLTFTCLHFYTYEWLSISFYHWYFYDIDLLLAAASLFGAMWLMRRGGRWLIGRGIIRRLPLKIVSGATVSIIAALLVLTVIPSRRLSDFRRDNRILSYGRLCSWLGKKLKSGDIVLSGEIGILGYLLPHTQIRDTNGIATTGVTMDNIEDLDYFANRFRPAYLLQSDGTDKMKLFPSGTGCLVYERAFCASATEGSGMAYNAAIYQYCDNYTPPPKLLRLLNVARGRVCSWQMAIRRIKKRWILFAHALFVSRIPVPPDATSVSISCGFIPDFYRNGIAYSDGVELRLSGIDREKEVLLQHSVFDPKGEKLPPHVKKIVSAEFPPETFQYVRFEIHPRRSNNCDWTYIDSFSFR